MTSHPPPYSSHDVTHFDNPGHRDESSPVYVKSGVNGGGYAVWTSGPPPAHDDYARLNPAYLGSVEHLPKTHAHKLDPVDNIHPGMPDGHVHPAQATQRRDSEDYLSPALVQKPTGDVAVRVSDVYMTIGDDTVTST